jgi:hypothetical protein
MKKIIVYALLFILSLSLALAATITLDTASGPGTAFSNQYIYNYDYALAHATATFNPVGTNFNAHISATGLKPGFTYQVKFEGKGSNSSGKTANEYLGYAGRWWEGTNRDDSYYATYKNNPGHNIIGYLVFDYITADSNGNAEADISSDGSYHVLWCGPSSGSNALLYNVDKTQPPFSTNTLKCSAPKLCSASNVIPQTERPAFTKLAEGAYANVIMTLNEESFHQDCGTWTTALTKELSFEVDYSYVPGESVPEFGLIAAGVALIGALAGLVLFRRH